MNGPWALAMKSFAIFCFKEVIGHTSFGMVDPNDERWVKASIVGGKFCHLNNDVSPKLHRKIHVTFKKIVPVTLGWQIVRRIAHEKIWSYVWLGSLPGVGGAGGADERCHQCNLCLCPLSYQ